VHGESEDAQHPGDEVGGGEGLAGGAETAMATKRKSRILDEMRETARDLHRLGFICKRRMGEFEALCKLELPALSARRLSVR
jgi:putative transcriptional regulator